jgi:hypothetical protein
MEQRYSLTPDGPIHTKSPSPDNRAYGPLTDYWTDFESENGFEKILSHCLEYRFSYTNIFCWPFKGQYAQIPHLRYRALTDYWSYFESVNGLWEDVVVDYNTGTGFHRPKLYSLTPQGPIRTKPHLRIIGPTGPPGPTIGPILNLKTVLRRYYSCLQNWYRLL